MIDRSEVVLFITVLIYSHYNPVNLGKMEKKLFASSGTHVYERIDTELMEEEAVITFDEENTRILSRKRHV